MKTNYNSSLLTFVTYNTMSIYTHTYISIYYIVYIYTHTQVCTHIYMF